MLIFITIAVVYLVCDLIGFLRVISELNNIKERLRIMEIVHGN
jgi:hypothetical protein